LAQITLNQVGIARIQGRSMYPTLQSGDLVVWIRIALHWLKPGQIVVARWPHSKALIAKRVAQCSASTVELVGDNPPESTDSRHFGAISRGTLAGVVVAIYRV